jgi:hypothetical protein
VVDMALPSRHRGYAPAGVAAAARGEGKKGQ